MQTGRDSHWERTESFTISMRSCASSLRADKALITQWCEECMREHMEPPATIVEIYGLQQSSSDWCPEWQLERTRLLKGNKEVGERFYLERDTLQEILIDAKLWASTSLRIYMVLGMPGVGKSEFIVWLAGQLQLPIYRVSLHDPKLTDSLLAQVFSQSWLKHDSMVVQLDEFQGALNRWGTSGDRADRSDVKGLSPGGLCEVLQGSTTLSRGVLVLAGTEELAREDYKKAFHALYRRINVEAAIGCMGEAGIRT